MRGVVLILGCSLAVAFGAPANLKLDELEKKLKSLFQDETEAKEMPTSNFEMKKSISLRAVEEVEGVYCGFFEIIEGKSLYGYNTKTLYDVTDQECMEACAYEYNFYCRSGDYNYSSNTCYLSSESDETQPHDFSDNFNTVYFRRSCEDPEPESAESAESGSGSGNGYYGSGYGYYY